MSRMFQGNKACWTYTMKSSMSMVLARFSQKPASCKTLSIFLLTLKSAGTSCHMTCKRLCTNSHPGQVNCTCRPDSPRCAASSGFCSSFPEAALLQRTWNPDSNSFRRLLHSGGSLFSSSVLTWKLRWGFCFSLQMLFWPGRPTPSTKIHKMHVSYVHLADISGMVSSLKWSSPGS